MDIGTFEAGLILDKQNVMILTWAWWCAVADARSDGQHILNVDRTVAVDGQRAENTSLCFENQSLLLKWIIL